MSFKVLGIVRKSFFVARASIASYIALAITNALPFGGVFEAQTTKISKSIQDSRKRTRSEWPTSVR